MSKSYIAEDVSIELMAEELGVELTSDALSSKSRRDATEEALTELSSARLSTPEYLTKMQEIANSASIALAELAKASGSKEASDLVSRFDEQIKGGVTSLAEGLVGQINASGRFGSDFEKLCSGTHGIIDSCLNLASHTKDDEDKKTEEERKRNAEMRKLMLIAAAVVAALFIGYFGIPIEVVLLAGVAIKALAENKDKSPLEMAKDFSEKIVSDENYREKAFEKALQVASIACPGLSVLGLGAASAGAISAIGGAKAASELFSRSKAMLAAIPRSPELMVNDVFKGLDKVIEKNLEEKPELCEKLKNLLSGIKAKEASSVILSLGGLVGHAIEERGIAGKASDLLSGTQGVNELISKFTKLAKTELSLSPAEQVFIEKIGKEMKQFVSEKYVKPVHQFCEAAKKSGAAELASRLGLSKPVLERVSSSISQLARSEPSAGKSR